MNMLGGVMLEASKDRDPKFALSIGPDALADALNVRELPFRPKIRPGRVAGTVGMPRPVTQLIGMPLGDVPWRRMVPGVRHYQIASSRKSPGDLRLLMIEPGRRLPDHGHRGAELTLVLTGSYVDKIGRFASGDVADLDTEIEHQPTVDSNQPCICLVASEQKARFKGIIGRLLQPLVGM